MKEKNKCKFCENEDENQLVSTNTDDNKYEDGYICIECSFEKGLMEK